MEIKELVVYEKEYPERKAVFSEFPQDMLPELKGYLENAGIPRLYCHQAEMFERAQKKKIWSSPPPQPAAKHWVFCCRFFRKS